MEVSEAQLLNFNRLTIRAARLSCGIQENLITPRMAQFNILQRLGAGTFGVVFRASTNVFKDNFVALKCIKEVRSVKDAAEEVRLLIKLRHENVIKILGAFHHLQPIIVFELGQCTIMQFKPTLEEGILILDGLLKGLQNMHAKGYLHSDIKPENLIICKGKAKLADFGSVTEINKSNEFTTLTHHKGTFCYQPLSTLRDNKINKSTDLFSLGVSIWEAITKQPFMAPRGKWIKKVATTEQQLLHYYIVVHGNGRFIESEVEKEPYADDANFSPNKPKLSQLMTNPQAFARMSLSVRIASGPFVCCTEEMIQVLRKLTGLSEFQSETVEQIRELPQFSKLLEKAMDASLHKRFRYSNAPLNQEGLKLLPEMDANNAWSALHFYYLNHAELRESNKPQEVSSHKHLQQATSAIHNLKITTKKAFKMKADKINDPKSVDSERNLIEKDDSKQYSKPAHAQFPKRFVCIFCGKSFHMRAILDDHVKTCPENDENEIEKVPTCSEVVSMFQPPSNDNLEDEEMHLSSTSDVGWLTVPCPTLPINKNTSSAMSSTVNIHLLS